MARPFFFVPIGLLALLLPALAVAQFAVTATTPAAQQLHAAPNTVVAATFSGAVAPAATSALKVHSAQRGGLRSGHSGSTTASGNTLAFSPTHPFFPGEVVSAIVTASALNSAGSAIVRSRVWQFTTVTGGTGRGSFPTGPDLLIKDGLQKVVAGDVDNDGDLDLLATDIGSNAVHVRLNDGRGNFTPAPVNPAPPVPPAPYDLALGDLDGDGDLDFVTANVNDASVSVRLNDGTGNFTPHPVGAEVPVAYGPSMLALGDLDGDGDLDLVTPSTSVSGRVSVRLNDGTGNFTTAADVLVGSVPLGLTLGDVDGDGDLDLAVANSGGNSVSIRLNNGAAGFTAPSQGAEIVVGTYPKQIALQDLDGDGDADMLVSNNNIGTVSLRLNNGYGVFAAPVSGAEIAVGGYPKGLALGDVDADGDIDFVINTNNLALYLNNGQAGFSGTYNAIGGIPSSPGSMALADVDNDGDLDLLAPGFNSLCHIRFNTVLVPPTPPAPPTSPPRDSLLATVPALTNPDVLMATPNPAHDVVQLTGLLPNNQLCLYDMTGRLLCKQLVTSSQATLALPPNLAAGIYVLQCGPRRRRLQVD